MHMHTELGTARGWRGHDLWRGLTKFILTSPTKDIQRIQMRARKELYGRKQVKFLALVIVPASGCTFLELLFWHFLFVHVFFYIYSRAWPLCSYS